ncbi:flagellin-like protein [Nostoc sp. HG1]|nr:flagellin-like protein [Nostoc sp. HG1]
MINATGNRMTQEIQRQSKLAQRIAVSQTQISSGKRLSRASDDPVATSRVATLRQAQANDAARTGNISIGIALTGQADGILRSVSDLMARVNELTIAGANSAMPTADRNVLAAEMTAIADEIDVQSLARSVTGQPLFANGNPQIIRFGADSAFAPVPSRSALFETGGMSVAQIVRNAASAVASGNAAQIGTSITAIAGAVDHIASASASVGLNAAKLDRLQDSSALRSIMLKEERSMLEDTDLSSAIAELNAQTLTLEAAQAAFARINRRSLMDFLN